MGAPDDVNVNERGVVDATEVKSWTWTVWACANSLTTGFQSYSLVANGSIIPMP